MIPQIREINLPAYATLQHATVTLADMGDRTITTQIKIDGDIVPNFVGREGTDAHGQDWELEFKGERYILPIRKPQATKDNTTINSLIDLTFYHWGIFQLKRFFFVELASVQSGTAIADKYIASLRVNLPGFAMALDNILRFYFPDRSIYVYQKNGSYINPDLTDYDEGTKAIEINHSYIWDVLQKTQELFDCRFDIELDQSGNYAIKFGYPTEEITHVFQYGYNGGLLSLQRQVQDDNIRNQLLGRGGSQNLPYMYFKDYEKFHYGSENSAYQNHGLPDPDAIPELENIYFGELRDSNFRSYIQGWKVNPRRQMSTADGWSVSIEAGVFVESVDNAPDDFWNGRVKTYSFDSQRAADDWAYAKGASDKKFDPVEYVKDDESIREYGLLQAGLDNNEDIFPTIQGMSLQLPCEKDGHNGHIVKTRADEVVDVEEVETDVIPSTGVSVYDRHREAVSAVNEIQTSAYESGFYWHVPAVGLSTVTRRFKIEDGKKGYIGLPPKISATLNYVKTTRVSSSSGVGPETTSIGSQEIDCELTLWEVRDSSGNVVADHMHLAPGEYYISALIDCDAIDIPRSNIWSSPIVVITGISDAVVKIGIAVDVTDYDFNGDAIEPGPVSTVTLQPEESAVVTLQSETFHVEDGALIADVPVICSPGAMLKNTRRIMTAGGEEVEGSSLTAGDYYVEVDCEITNTDMDSAHTYGLNIGVIFIYYGTQTESWKPTFDIWVKNIFETDRSKYSNDEEYAQAVWGPLISSEEMAITFTTGNLSGHSDWEFKINAFSYDNSKLLTITDDEGVEHIVRSEWRLTLIKSDAEADAIHQYVPYKDFNAVPKDRFFFTGIYLPWSYVYAAEARLNVYKEDALLQAKDINPTWVVSLDKIRLHDPGMETEKLKPGSRTWIKDGRFTPQTGVPLFISSITYNFLEEIVGTGLPDIDIVLTDKVQPSMSPVEQIKGDIEDLSTQVSGLSNVDKAIRRLCDMIYLRKDGNSEISYSPTRIARTLSSQNFTQGAVSGEGWGAYQDANGDSVIEVDKIVARKELNVNSLVVNQVTSIGGKEILSAANMTISQVMYDEDGNYICYFDQRGGSLSNLFKVDDVAFSQIFDDKNKETKYYKRRVIEVGLDNIVLSAEDVDGDGEPAEGDVVAQYGNYTDKNRQYVIIRDVIGGGYEQMLSGLSSVSSRGKEYYFAGMVKGGSEEFIGLNDSDDAELLDYDNLRLGYVKKSDSPRWFVGDSDGEYAEWKNGRLFVKGVIEVTGGNVAHLANALAADNTIIAGGMVLSSFMGVKDSQDNIVAAINGSDQIADYYDNSVGGHGILMFASGIPVSGVAKTDASTRIFADGTIITNKLIATSANISGDVTTGNLTATGGAIGGININQNGLGISSISPGSSSAVSGMYLSGQYIGFSDGSNVRAYFGSNVLPAVAGFPGAISVEMSTNSPTDLKAIGASVSVSGYRDSIAFQSNAGVFAGLRPDIRVINSDTVLTDNLTTTFIVSGDCQINLPQTFEKGETYIFCIQNVTATIAGVNKQIVLGDNRVVSSVQIAAGNPGILFVTYSGGTYWYATFIRTSW